MNCPTFKNVTLEKTERLGFYFESCPSCNGMWFERAELNKVLDKLATDQTIETIHSTEDKNSTHSHQYSAITQKKLNASFIKVGYILSGT